jgi:hypothetical protein
MDEMSFTLWISLSKGQARRSNKGKLGIAVIIEVERDRRWWVAQLN